MKYSEAFLKVAELGAKMDTMYALNLLCDAYIDMCGVSAGSRTVYHRAGDGWKKKLGESKHELALDARNHSLTGLFPFINKRYIPEEYNDYDISPMPEPLYVEIAEELLRENSDNEELAKALCAGIVFSNETEDLLDFLNTKEWLLCYVDAHNGDYYKILLYRSELEESRIKLHLFKNKTLMKDFHFTIDFSHYLATDELKLIYQKDKEKELENTGDACLWGGYEDVHDLLLEHFEAPVKRRTMRYRSFENQLHEMIVSHDSWAKHLHTMTMIEKMDKLGLVPLSKYMSLLKDEQK